MLPPAPPADWSGRTASWLDSEAPLGAADALAGALAQALREAWDSQPEDLDAAHAALLRRAAHLDELRATLLRLAERVDQERRLAQRQTEFGDAWRNTLPRQLRDAGDGAGALWLRHFRDALAAWRLDACDWLLQSPIIEPDRLAEHRRALQHLRDDPGQAMLGPWLDRLAAGGKGDSMRRLRVLQARLAMHHRHDLPAAAAALEAAAGALQGPVAGLFYTGWGEWYLLSQRAADATANFDNAIAAAQDLPDPLVGRGRVALLDGRRDEADAWFDRALQRVALEADPLAALQRLLAPCPSRLLMRLALTMPAPDAAVEAALAVDMQPPATPLDRPPQEVAEALHQAARSRVGTDAMQAAQLHAQEAGLAPGQPRGWWYWADALYLASFTPRPPYADEALLRQALAVWRRGAALGAPQPPHGWAWLTRGVILGRLAEVRFAERDGLLWQALRSTEAALVLDPRHGYAWSTLSRLHRTLGNDECALAAARKGVEIYPDDLNTLEELVIILVNTHRHAEALQHMARWRELGGTRAWIDAVEAHVLLLSEGDDKNADWRRALALVDEKDLDPRWFWARVDRGSLHIRLGDSAEAAREWDRVLQLEAEAEPSDLVDLYSAFALRGQADKALARVEAMRGDPSTRDAAAQLAGLAYLMRGGPGDDEAALAQWREWIGRCSPRDLSGWLVGQAADLRGVLGADPALAGRLALLARIEAEVRAALRERPPRDNPVAELEQLLIGSPDDFGRSSDARLGLLASLARSRREAGLFTAAVAGYRELGEGHEPWPRALEPWEQAVEQTLSDLFDADAATVWQLAAGDDALAAAANRAALARLNARLNWRADAAYTSAYAQAIAPLRVYLGRGLIEATERDRFEAQVVEPLRQRMLQRMGVELPGIALQDSAGVAHMNGSYVIAADDISLVRGSLSLAEPPAAGDWLPLVDALESELQPLLGELFDTEAALRWLRRAAAEPGSRATAEAVAARPAELQRLSRLLRALLAEGVPVTEPGPLLAAFEQVRGLGFDEQLRALRRAPPGRLPGPAGARQLPASIASELRPWLRQQGGRSFLALPPERAQSLLATVRTLIDDEVRALVVDDPELRGPLQRLIALEHPQLPLLAGDELARPAVAVGAGRADES